MAALEKIKFFRIISDTDTYCDIIKGKLLVFQSETEGRRGKEIAVNCVYCVEAITAIR